MNAPQRILLIRPSALGDVCRTVPVLASLHRRWPDAAIDWLVQDDFAPAVAAHPGLRAVVPFPRRRLAGWWRRPAAARELLALLNSLRAARYDLVLDCQGLARSAALSLATRAPRRLTYRDAPECAWLAATERIDAPRAHHTVDRMLALAQAAGATPVRDMRLYTAPDDRRAARDILAGHRTVLLAPTSRWPAKRWPAERFAALAEALLAESPDLRIAVVGAPGERDQCAPLLALGARDDRIIDLVGSTPIPLLLALVEAAALIVANDSAVLHMAVGCDRPIVALFGPTDVSRVGPYQRENDVLQRIGPGDRFDHKHSSDEMMRRIPLDDVLQACLARLKSPERPPARADSASIGNSGPARR